MGRGRLGLCLSLAGFLAACSSGAWGSWEHAHVVDGYYVANETACPQSTSRICTPALAAAARVVGSDVAGRVVGIALAAPPSSWVDMAGQHHSVFFGGLEAPVFAVLTLGDGSRRAVPLMCMPDVTTMEDPTKVVTPAHCEVFGRGDLWREGAGRPPDGV